MHGKGVPFGVLCAPDLIYLSCTAEAQALPKLAGHNVSAPVSSACSLFIAYCVNVMRWVLPPHSHPHTLTMAGFFVVIGTGPYSVAKGTLASLDVVVSP